MIRKLWRHPFAFSHCHRRTVFCYIVLVLLFGLAGPSIFAAPARPQGHLTIENVSAHPRFFEREKGETTEIAYKLGQDANVTLKIYDESDYLVTTLLSSINRHRGDNKENWSGTDQSGHPVQPGLYRFVIEAVDHAGMTVSSDLTDLTGGQDNEVATSEIDSVKGIVTYVLKSPSMVITRLGLAEGGPLLRTLEMRKAKPGGLNRVAWDGFDNSGTVNFLQHPKLDLSVQAYSLSANSIVVTGSGDGHAAAEIPLKPSRERRPRKMTPRKIIRNHWQHAPEKCRDPELRLELPDGTPRDQDGTAIVTGPLRIRVDLAGPDRLLFTEERFEVMFFLDFLFVYEEEAGFLPYNWTWKPRGISRGLHYITVNLLGYEGHIGSTTLKVRLE